MKKRRIIDSHAHLGDIFHENKNITFKTGIKKGDYEDPFVDCERSGYNIPLIPKDPTDLINAGQFRSWEWTLENCAKEMDEMGIDYVVMLPIWPNTTFEEYWAASKLDPRIIPFTSPDFSLHVSDLQIKLRKDIERGAKGVKLHPTIQNMPLDDPKTKAVVNVFAEAGLPIVTHVGANPYYTPDKPWATNPSNSEASKVWEFCRANPHATIICAHCGGNAGVFIEAVGDLKHVYTDTTMCNRNLMKKAVEALGPERLLFGSDVPFGSFKPSVEEMEIAFADQPEVADMCFYSNMARLMKMPY